MPFRRRFRPRRFNRFRRRGRRVGPGLRAPRWNFAKRAQQNLTREVRHFKWVVAIRSNNTGVLNFNVQTSDVTNGQQFDLFSRIWEEYKILTINMKLFPSNVGGESQQYLGPSPPPAGIPLFQRGDTVTYCDPNAPGLPPQGINDVMGKSSARLFNPRRYHKRWINRPRGYPGWGAIDPNGVITTPDPWPGSITLFGDNFTPVQVPGSQIFFYGMLTFKVLFRSRQDA